MVYELAPLTLSQSKSGRGLLNTAPASGDNNTGGRIAVLKAHTADQALYSPFVL
jgi:hypothetical protein